MNLFDILSNDERVIVLSNVGERMMVTWNQSLTLQAWGKVYDPLRGYDDSEDKWEELECQTLSDQPANYKAARKAAETWVRA